MANSVRVWDGTQWLNKTVQIYNATAKAWQAKPPLYYDNQAWMSEAPTPEEFPSYWDSITSNFVGADVVTCAIPDEVRTNDFVVSICAQQDGPTESPRLLSPPGVIPTLYTINGGIRFHVAVWPWEPSKGDLVVWNTQDSDNTACMNLIYRYGDVANTSLNPIVSMTGFNNVMSVPLPASQDFTNLYVVLTVATTLTGNAWPDGVEELDSVMGTFGSKAISLMAADTPGAGASPGHLQLDTTVDTAVVALIQIPGKSDGLPTWILGDTKGSVLGTTTRLG